MLGGLWFVNFKQTFKQKEVGMYWGCEPFHDDPYGDSFLHNHDEEEEKPWWTEEFNGNGRGRKNGNGNGSDCYSSDAALLDELREDRDDPFSQFILQHHRQIASSLSGFTIGKGGERRSLSNSFMEIKQAYLDATTLYSVSRRSGRSHQIFHYFMQHLKNTINKANIAESKQFIPLSAVTQIEDKDGKPFREDRGYHEFSCNPFTDDNQNTVEHQIDDRNREKLNCLLDDIIKEHGHETTVKLMNMIRNKHSVIRIHRETGVDIKKIFKLKRLCDELGL